MHPLLAVWDGKEHHVVLAVLKLKPSVTFALQVRFVFLHVNSGLLVWAAGAAFSLVFFKVFMN